MGFYVGARGIESVQAETAAVTDDRGYIFKNGALN